MKVKDIVSVVDETQQLSIDVIMQDDVDGDVQTYSMTWKGYANGVPLNIMRTIVTEMYVDSDEDFCLCNCFKIISEE